MRKDQIATTAGIVLLAALLAAFPGCLSPLVAPSATQSASQTPTQSLNATQANQGGNTTVSVGSAPPASTAPP